MVYQNKPWSDRFHIEFIAIGRIVRRRVRNTILVSDTNAEAVITERIQIADVAAATTNARANRFPITVGAFAHLHLSFSEERNLDKNR